MEFCWKVVYYDGGGKGDNAMNFKIEDILNGTVDGVSKETIIVAISEVIDGENIVATVEEINN